MLPRKRHGLFVLRRLFCVLALLLCLQLYNLPNKEFGVISALSDAGLNLVEVALESTESGKPNALGNFATAPEHVRDGGVPTENMAVANAKDLGTSVAMLVLVFVEEKRHATLSIISLPLLRSNRNAERCSE